MFVLDSIKTYAATDRIALINREERLSFAQLEARSEAFAHWLLGQLGEDRTPVVIYGHKETDFLPCIFGALKAGRAYVPVDVAVPRERAAEIVADVQPKVVVDFSADGLQADATVLNGASLERILQRPPHGEVPKETWVTGNATAYILFTSGSTGKPKGVPITAANLTNFYRGLLPYLGEGEEGVILNQVSYSFDVSGCSLYAGLSRGMTLFTVDGEMVADVGTMFRYLQQSRLAVWVSTPSFAEICAGSKAFSADLLPGVRTFLFCGEVLTHKLCDQLAQRFPSARILNTYGPTEATVLVSAVWVSEEMRRDERPIPIGYPLEEVTLELLDQQGGAVEQDGAQGELVIVSDSVGPGYYKRPDLTRERFFVDEKSGKRAYRTGDICYREAGLYYYAGRADNQLKLGGYRIELEDIENNLTRIDNIARAAVVPVWDAAHSRVQYLAAFVLLEQDDGLSPLKRAMRIKQQAAAILPSYMIPRKIVAVDAFPLNQSGKVDKKALAARLEKAAKP